ncbi:MAG: amidohydrolase family protein [Spirochaetota bacterium]
MSNHKLYSKLYDYITSRKIINTHSHHLQEEDFKDFNLDILIKNSYVNWCGVEPGNDKEGRAHFLQLIRHRSYFVWFQKALQELYNFKKQITSDNWLEISNLINEAHKNPEHHLNILTKNCRYKKIILDAYWNPGSDNGFPELFIPTFRINMFLYSYDKNVSDHNGNNALLLYKRKPKNIDEFISFMEEIIQKKKAQGCIALKSALAYDRNLAFRETSKKDAERIFNKSGREASIEDILLFQGYTFFEICRIAARLELPLQCHTGLGELDRTNAIQLREVIVKNPDTKFILFHGGYPWTDDICALVHRYPNVYVDLCWLPLISPSAAERLINELIEVGNSDKMMWGCDTWTSEESYAALLALRHVLANVLRKKVEDGYTGIGDAFSIIDRVTSFNASELYRIRGLVSSS